MALDQLWRPVSASPWTYAVILVVAALDAVLPLVPSETAVISAGVLAGAGDLSLGLVIAAGAAGAFAGDSSAYWLGRRFDRRLERRLFRSAKGAERRAWAEGALNRYGGPLIFGARFVPGGRTATTVTAGLLRTRWARFAAFAGAAGVAWASYAALLGYLGGRASKRRSGASSSASASRRPPFSPSRLSEELVRDRAAQPWSRFPSRLGSPGRASGCMISRAAGGEQFGDELRDPLVHLVANGAHLVHESCLAGIGEVPVLVALARIDRARAPQPIVMTTSAALTTSSVSGFGYASDRSTPRSVMACATRGLIASAGADPAERAWMRPLERRARRAAAIWERPAFWGQTKSTSGCPTGSRTATASLMPTKRCRRLSAAAMRSTEPSPDLHQFVARMRL